MILWITINFIFYYITVPLNFITKFLQIKVIIWIPIKNKNKKWFYELVSILLYNCTSKFYYKIFTNWWELYLQESFKTLIR